MRCTFLEAVILGSTYTGSYESVEEMAALLDEYQEKTGIDVPCHVDAASGGLFCPFATPDLKWDFRIRRVVSINTSGHKWGKAYVGVGWIVFRDKEHREPWLLPNASSRNHGVTDERFLVYEPSVCVSLGSPERTRIRTPLLGISRILLQYKLFAT